MTEFKDVEAGTVTHLEEMSADQVTFLLAAVVKLHGENNVLRIPDVSIKFPFRLKITPATTDEAYLLLVEGDAARQLHEVEDAIPNST